MFNPMSRPLRRSPQARRRLACRPCMESLEVREVLSLGAGLTTIAGLASLTTIPANSALPALVVVDNTRSPILDVTPSIHAGVAGQFVIFSGTSTPGTQVILIPPGGQLATETGAIVPPGITALQTPGTTGSQTTYTWTVSIPLAVAQVGADGTWSMSVASNQLPTATSLLTSSLLTFQFIQNGSSVDQYFAYRPDSLGPVALPGSSSDTPRNLDVVHEVKVGELVIFSGIAAPGADICLLPPGNQLQTYTSTTKPTDVPFYTTSTDSAAKVTYHWATSIPLGEVKADESGRWSMSIASNLLPTAACNLTFQTIQNGSMVSQSFIYDPNPGPPSTLPASGSSAGPATGPVIGPLTGPSTTPIAFPSTPRRAPLVAPAPAPPVVIPVPSLLITATIR